MEEDSKDRVLKLLEQAGTPLAANRFEERQNPLKYGLLPEKNDCGQCNLVLLTCCTGLLGLQYPGARKELERFLE